MDYNIIQSINYINKYKLTNTIVTEEGYIYDLFENNLDNSITFNLVSKDCNYIKTHITVDSGINIKNLTKRQYVKVSGFLKIDFKYENGGSSPIIQIEATKIEIISHFTSQIFKTNQLPIPDLYDVGRERIKVITGRKNKGYNDLEAKVFKSIKQKLCKESIPLQKKDSIYTIADRIKTINEENSADLICIVRGGGEEAFIGYIFDNEPISLAIQNSKIPVLVAIGHADDATVSDMVSDAPCIINPETNEKDRRFFTTPTDLGYFLNEELKKHFHQNKTPVSTKENIPLVQEPVKAKNSDYFLYFSYIVLIAVVYFLYQQGAATYLYETCFPALKNYSLAAFLVIGIILMLYNIHTIIGLVILYFLFQFALHLIEGTSK